jgi:hypothetical protein
MSLTSRVAGKKSNSDITENLGTGDQAWTSLRRRGWLDPKSIAFALVFDMLLVNRLNDEHDDYSRFTVPLCSLIH